MHVPGAIKVFLDHMAFRWIPHKPHKAMFSKRAVIISQCLGTGAKSAAKDIKDSLSWWEISNIKVFTVSLMSNIVWNNLPLKKITKKINKLSRNIAKVEFSKPAHTSFKTKLKFYMCKMIQESVGKRQIETLDLKYWTEQGWLDSNRPWMMSFESLIVVF